MPAAHLVFLSNAQYVIYAKKMMAAIFNSPIPKPSKPELWLYIPKPCSKWNIWILFDQKGLGLGPLGNSKSFCSLTHGYEDTGSDTYTTWAISKTLIFSQISLRN